MTNSNLTLNRPLPFEVSDKITTFKRGDDALLAIKTLEAGKPVLIIEYYNNGLALLKELQDYINGKLPNKTFAEQREFRSVYQRLSNLILVEIKDHKLALNKSPGIGWLAKLYPETSNFFLSFPQVQGLNSAWQWYQNGISIPVLRNKVHPFYGTYFPTRFDHLLLFDNWLKRYEGPKKAAIDVGIGSGVLSLLMVQHGFQKVFGTDINPNAVVGLTEFMGTTKLSRKIELDYANLFGKWDKPTELIVFNPPWLPKSRKLNRLDEAIYYDEKLFTDFFEGAKERLLPEGKLVLIFSNLAQITEASKTHPIENELANGGRFVLEKCFTKSVKAASDKTKRDAYWRAEEAVELWVLVHKQ